MDLTVSDFGLFDSGKPQKISFFAMTSATPLRQAAARNPKDVFTNRSREGRSRVASGMATKCDVKPARALSRGARDQQVRTEFESRLEF